MQFEIDSDITSNEECCLIKTISVFNNSITYNQFFKEYMLNNIPCIFQNITVNWKSNKEWLNEDNTPNLSNLNILYGNSNVTIYDCNKKYYNTQETEDVTFEQFLKLYWNQNNSAKYLKDWHLKNQYKNDDFYQVPIYFASDWLNEYLVETLQDDYRFVYMGRAGTWTPFHADVFGSYSWSANVCGKKKWILIPPGEENLLKNSLGNLPYDITEHYKKIKHFEIIQNKGEAIFVPSGWYHQVWNLEDTISVNHNWINGCNIMKMWQNLVDNLYKVKKQIEDCQDMENYVEHCQVVLKASFGIDFYQFFDFIKFISKKRLEYLKSPEKAVLFHGYQIGPKHIEFDLKAVGKVLDVFMQHEEVIQLFGENKEIIHSLKRDLAQFI